MANAVEDFEAPSVWDVLRVIELLRTLRTNGQELGPTSEWYLTGQNTRAAREQEMEEDSDCGTCRNYSVRKLRYDIGRADEVTGRAGLSEQLNVLQLVDFVTLINLVQPFGYFMYHQI